MSEFDLEGAVEALSGDLPDDYESPVDSVVDETPVGDNQSEAESFTGFDPNVLPEDMQKVYKSMQADYTRKTQEIAEQRRQYEAFAEIGVDPNEAVSVLNLWQAMDSDPQVAAEFASAIQNRLQEMGAVNAPVEDVTPENVSYDGLPPSVAKELEEMRAFRHEMLEAQQQQEIMSKLEVEEQTIRTANPDYSDDDLDTIYSLAHATDGDLMAAAQQYHAIQQRLLGGYLQAKTVPHGATPAPGGPSSVPGRSFGSLDDAHKAAMEAIRNIS
jgi:hypothetical protein